MTQPIPLPSFLLGKLGVVILKSLRRQAYILQLRVRVEFSGTDVYLLLSRQSDGA